MAAEGPEPPPVNAPSLVNARSPRTRRFRIPRVLAGCAALLAAACGPSPAPSTAPSPEAALPPATFVGSARCASCHKAEFEAWQGSQHAVAMQQPTATTILAPFGGETLTADGVTSTFFRRDGKYVVRTDGPDGKLADFEVKYAFGVAPLQQYLVELPRGHVQALRAAWDARPKEEGGQRWFHLYPGERIPAGDELHWTGRQQNWNFMCADCHSTNVRKNYDAGTRTYRTSFSEISVGCEACHGPASRHMDWAAHPQAWPQMAANKGIVAPLVERHGVTWAVDKATGQPARSTPRATEFEIGMCARCHARRAQLTDDVTAADRLDDGFRIALLDPGLYHPDGQMLDEVYNYGSFLQSRMYAKGVTCSDCHEPHTMKTRAPGNGVCLQCHDGTKYDAPAHHFHKPGTDGARCSSCHMPTATYMVVDPRHDHSFRVPRPDLSVALGTPNACNACHRDRSAPWAAAEIAKRRPAGAAPGSLRFGEAFASFDRGARDAAAGLAAIAADPAQPAIVRASALARLANEGAAVNEALLSGATRDPSALVRAAAASALEAADPALRARLLGPLLVDPSRSVRIEAAHALAGVPAAGLSPEVQAALPRATEEYLDVQRFNADRPEAMVNLGTALAAGGDFDAAQRAFLSAIESDRAFIPAYVNLADVYRGRGQEAEAERTLRDALAAMPASGAAHHALGLSLIRQSRAAEAVAELGEAARLEPDNARFAYVYVIALHDTGDPARALTRARRGAEAAPGRSGAARARGGVPAGRGAGPVRCGTAGGRPPAVRPNLVRRPGLSSSPTTP